MGASGLIALDRFGAKALNTFGLAFAGLGYAAFLFIHVHLPGYRWTLFTLLCLMLFGLSFGPSIATYVLPVMCFPKELRSTFHGISAAAAKVGAMVGAFLF